MTPTSPRVRLGSTRSGNSRRFDSLAGIGLPYVPAFSEELESLPYLLAPRSSGMAAVIDLSCDVGVAMELEGALSPVSALGSLLPPHPHRDGCRNPHGTAPERTADGRPRGGRTGGDGLLPAGGRRRRPSTVVARLREDVRDAYPGNHPWSHGSLLRWGSVRFPDGGIPPSSADVGVVPWKAG